jgi:predicted HicB family RNase H-like nuclease
MSGQREWPQLMVRLPSEVKAWVASQAARNGASMNSEIIRTLRERMDRDAARQGGGQTAGNSLAG